MMHERILLVAFSAMVALGLAATGCGGDGSSVEWEAGSAAAVLSLDDGTVVTFEGGTCQRGTTSTGSDSFRLGVGEPGADGEGVLINIGLELSGGATFAGDGSGNGVQVDHAGGRWGLGTGTEALTFDDDLGGGTVDLMGISTLGADADPRSGTVVFTC
jgi:hypothetical protein